MKIEAKSPQEYIAKLEEPRKSDVETLHKLILKTVPKLKPEVVYGMLGYGKYHYKSKSGQEGDWSVIGLASQKNYISFYASCIEKNGKYLAEEYNQKLPKANIGRSCIRFKKLADVDLEVIKEILLKAEKLGGMNYAK